MCKWCKFWGILSAKMDRKLPIILIIEKCFLLVVYGFNQCQFKITVAKTLSNKEVVPSADLNNN